MGRYATDREVYRAHILGLLIVGVGMFLMLMLLFSAIVRTDQMRDNERVMRMGLDLPCMKYCPVMGRIETINRRKGNDLAKN